MAMTAPFRYPALVRVLHWLAVALVAVAYLTSESAEEAGGGGQWHVLAGLALIVVFVPWLLARLIGPRPPPPPPPGLQAWTARLVHVALLLFVVVEPMLGVLTVWAEGHALAVPFTSWRIAPLVALGDWWEERLEDLHATVGNVFYAVIALHALAALWHQFIRRDGTLRRMTG
jgi:cytochrome b561